MKRDLELGDASVVTDIAGSVCVNEARHPWVDTGAGSRRQMIRFDRQTATWVSRNRFEPGYRAVTHRHTGSVHAFTLTGAWAYDEYDFAADQGAYVYEMAGSVHTLHVLEENEGVTDVLFIVQGALLFLGPSGEITSYADGSTQLESYVRLCIEQGHAVPDDLVT